jgi:hypothetical protein
MERHVGWDYSEKYKEFHIIMFILENFTAEE